MRQQTLIVIEKYADRPELILEAIPDPDNDRIVLERLKQRTGKK